MQVPPWPSLTFILTKEVMCIFITVLECILDGRHLTQAECEKGIADGSLRYVDGDSGEVSQVASGAVAVCLTCIFHFI